MKKISKSIEIHGKTITLETGELAKQATSSVLARMGDTMVLVTVTAGKQSDLGYFPLSVEYVERLYAGGRIKGSRWVKREGRPSDDAVLTGRLIDRSIRPLFPKEYKNDVQVVVTVLSVDGENEPDILSLIGVSAALHMSPIPWNGPISATRMGYVQEKEGTKAAFIVNPGRAELALSDLDIVVSQTKDKTHMIEAGALQVSEEIAYSAIEQAHKPNNELIAFIEEFAKEAGTKKVEVTPDTVVKELVASIEKNYRSELEGMIKLRATKESSGGEYDELLGRIFEEQKAAEPETQIDKKSVAKAAELVFFKIIRDNVLKKGQRADGRKVDEIRPISGMVGILPRTHGSAIFQRGDTQALTVVTLGSPRMEQLIESAEGEEIKRYIHHYSMPPYSVGETGRMGTPSRREIGHGALAERAIEAVIPTQDKFPYTIRVVSEILSSNGSTSMASTCGSTLALMDAGVPITKPVAGIAMGIVTSEDKYVLLTDILGLEDFSGDMDFKVAGTDTGITAIQLDVKIPGLTDTQIKEILERARQGRLFILEKMLAVLPQSRAHISEYAPKIEQVTIPVEKIGEIIGPGGRVIKNIIATTGAQVDVEDSGIVTISGTSEDSVKQAVDWIKGLTRELQVGEEFEGEVKRILPFGAFVEVLPGKEGMVHVSQMSTEFVKNPTDVVQIGQKVKVRVYEIDEQGRVNLTMLDKDAAKQPRRPQQNEGPREQRPMTPASEHPLSMQFKRERSQQQSDRPWRQGGRGRGGQGGRQRSGFKKTHY
jgi:polyribonucleotide nucleotidyltransferase